MVVGETHHLWKHPFGAPGFGWVPIFCLDGLAGNSQAFPSQIHVWLGGGNSNIFYFQPEPWGNDQICLSYFSDGLKPPTRWCITYIYTTPETCSLRHFSPENGWLHFMSFPKLGQKACFQVRTVSFREGQLIFCYGKLVGKYTIQGGPLPVISGVITPINGFMNGQLGS